MTEEQKKILLDAYAEEEAVYRNILGLGHERTKILAAAKGAGSLGQHLEQSVNLIGNSMARNSALDDLCRIEKKIDSVKRAYMDTPSDDPFRIELNKKLDELLDTIEEVLAIDQANEDTWAAIHEETEA